MGASADAERRPVSHPRSSNRTCPIKASGFPTGFTADSRTRLRLGSAELQYSQLAKHHFDAEAVGTARLHLVTPPQEMPYALLPGGTPGNGCGSSGWNCTPTKRAGLS